MRIDSPRLCASDNHGIPAPTDAGEKGGIMAVNVGQRNVPDTPQNRQLDAGMKARELAIYTIRICTNQKVFLPEYRSALTEDIIRTAKDIYMNVWTANNILVKTQEQWDCRSRLQQKAALQCNNLLALISIARTLFHLKGKRVNYWSGMVIETRGMIQKWHEADRKRYGTK